MANSDYTIADQTGANFLTDINGQLAAIQTNNSKTTAPVAADGKAVGMLWYNSATTTQSGIPSKTVAVCVAANGVDADWESVGNTNTAINTLITSGITGKEDTLSASNQVSETQLANNAVTNAKMANDAIDVDELNATVNATPTNDAGKVLTLNAAGTGLEWSGSPSALGGGAIGTLLMNGTAGASGSLDVTGLDFIYVTAVGGGGGGGSHGNGDRGGTGSGGWVEYMQIDVSSETSVSWGVALGGTRTSAFARGGTGGSTTIGSLTVGGGQGNGGQNTPAFGGSISGGGSLFLSSNTGNSGTTPGSGNPPGANPGGPFADSPYGGGGLTCQNGSCGTAGEGGFILVTS